MELFDVLDDSGNKTGEIKSRSQVHNDGNWHRAAHVWIVNSRGELLVQKRAPNKDSHPNCWDISCAGHVVSGDDGIGTAIKEIKEELSLDVEPKNIKYLFTLKRSSVTNKDTFINNEFDDVFIVKLDFNPNTITLQKEEVSEIKWVPTSEIKRVINVQDETYVLHNEEYSRIIEYINSIYTS